MESESPQRKLAVILHADVVGSTALVHLDETVAHQRLRGAFQRFSKAIEAYGGVVREIRGDALVAEFSRASDAVEAAIAAQTKNTDHNAHLDVDIRPAADPGNRRLAGRPRALPQAARAGQRHSLRGHRSRDCRRRNPARACGIV